MAARESILLLHGTASTPKQWRLLEEALACKFRVQCPTVNGYEEDRQAQLPAFLGLQARSEALMNIIAQSPEPVHLIGHSFGGALVLNIAEHLPDRVRSVTVYEPTALRVLHSSSESQDLGLLADIRCLAEVVDRASPLVAMESFINFWLGGQHWPSMRESAQLRLANYALLAARDFQDALFETESSTFKEAYTGPVNVLVGAESVSISKRIGQRLKETLPQARLEFLPGCGHLAPITQAEVFNQKILSLFAD